MTCSYLIAVQGWTEEAALGRFSERRMRPGWGDGVSIKSQRRWVTYVGRWCKDGKRYKEGKVKIVEIRLWGLRENTRVAIRGFVEEGKRIEVVHQWSDAEADTVKIDKDELLAPSATEIPSSMKNAAKTADGTLEGSSKGPAVANGNTTVKSPEGIKSPAGSVSSGSYLSSTPPPPTLSILRPKKPIVLPSFDVNIEVEKRNKNFSSMVTSTAHSWFNVYFEGKGPENDGEAEKSGVYTVEWDSMDGLKGSSRRGMRAVEKIAVVWQIVDDEEAAKVEQEVKVTEPEKPGDIDSDSDGKGKITGSEVASDSDAEDGVQSYGVAGEKV